MTTHTDLVNEVAAAIKVAQAERPYGLYDYTRYPGDGPAHVVRNEHTNTIIAGYSNAEIARHLYDQLSSEYVAQAAIKATMGWLEADLVRSWNQFNSRPYPWPPTK
jgi:hypothetical protein